MNEDRGLVMLAAIWIGISVLLLGLIPAIGRIAGLLRRLWRARRRHATYRRTHFLE